MKRVKRKKLSIVLCLAQLMQPILAVDLDGDLTEQTRFNPCLNKISSLVSDIDSKVSVVESLIETTCAGIPLSGPGPITISSPGSYCLISDFSDTITITAPQVTLDLNGHTVSSPTTGIVVGGLTPDDIIIRNGAVQATNDDTGTGISILSGGSNIQLRGVSIQNWSTGVTVKGVSNFIVTGSLFLNNDSVGLKLADLTNAEITGSSFSGNSTGLQLTDVSSTTKGIKVQNCSFHQLQAALGSGVNITSGDCIEFINCSATGEASQFSGFAIASSASDVLFKECFACDFSNNAGGEGNGFRISGVTNMCMESCVAKNNSRGFWVKSNSTSLIRDSIATHNNTGFVYDGTGDGQFYRNMACENTVFNYSPTIGSAPVTSPANALGADNIDCSNTDKDQIDLIESNTDILVNFLAALNLSNIQALASEISIITSELDVTISKLDIAASLAEMISENLASFADVLAKIDSDIDINTSILELVESKTDACCTTENSKLNVINSKIDNIGSNSSQLEVIESKADACCVLSNSKLDGLQSTVSAIDSKTDACCTLENSKLDNIISKDSVIESKTDACCTLENSKLDNIISKDSVIESKADACCALENSKLDALNSKIDNIVINSEGSRIDNIISRVAAIDSKTDACCTLENSKLDNITSRVSAFDSKTDACCTLENSKLDNLTSRTAAIDSKTDACCTLENSKLDNIISKDSVIESKTDACCTTSNSKLDSISSKESVIESKTDACCTLENSKLDNIISKDSVIESKADACCTTSNSKLDSISSKETVIESKTDACCTLENSKLDNITSRVAVVDSKVDFYAQCNATPVIGPATISTAGTYCLVNNFNVAAGTGITISASNVKLNLNKRAITGTGGNFGVVTNSGTNDILIENGIIRNLAADGLLVQSNRTMVQNCDFIANSTGITLSGASDCAIQNCNAMNNTQAGFSLVNSSNCNVIENCNAIGTLSTADNAYGFFSSGGSSNIFNNCVADCVQTTTGGVGFIAAGFLLTNTETSSQIINSAVSSTTAPSGGDAVPYGIFAQQIFAGLTTEISRAATTVAVNDVEWTNDYKTLALGCNANPFLQTFTFNGGVLTAGQSQGAGFAAVQAVDYSPDNRYLAVGGAASGGTTFRIVDPNAIATNFATVATGATVNDLSWSPNGQFIAIVQAAAGTAPAGEVRVFQFTTSNTLTQVSQASHGAAVRGVSWSNDGNFIAIGGVAGTGGFDTRVYPVSSAGVLGTPVNATNGATVNDVNFHPNTKYLASGSASSGGTTVRIWSFNGAALTSVATSATGATVNDVNFDLGGGHLASGQNTGGGNEVRIFSFSNSTNTLTLQSTQSVGANVLATVWAPRTNFLAAAGALSTTIGLHIYSSTVTGANKCIIQNNTVTGVTGGSTLGIGLLADTSQNTVMGNTVSTCDNNYNYVTNVYAAGLFGSPTALQNIAIPPI